MTTLSHRALHRIARVLQASQVVALTLVCGMGAALVDSVGDYQTSDQWVEHTHEVLEQIERVRVTLLRGGVALRN